MYRHVEDFLTEWERSAAGTTAVFKALTDETLNQAIVEGHSTLGWLAWHLTNAPLFFAGNGVGLTVEPVGNPQEVPTSANVIVEAYEKMNAQVTAGVRALTNAQLVEEVPFIHGNSPKGVILRAMIDHQTHHRGQMTVLLRQAGLEVPPIMGPTQEMSQSK